MGLVYDAIQGQLLLLGGYTAGHVYLNDTWTLTWASDRPAEACVGLDADQDGRFGCDDPDCFGRCTPRCPPGTLCDPAWPRCGDGVCSGLESCRLCPADCDACTPVCGDCFCDPGETTATCPGDCALCGDGIRQANEACDDGNTVSGDGCSAGCQLEP
jgi:cysteine-rich repeat protein